MTSKSRPVSTRDTEPAVSLDRDRSVPRMSEGTRQDILIYGKAEDPHNPGTFLTAADLPQ